MFSLAFLQGTVAELSAISRAALQFALFCCHCRICCPCRNAWGWRLKQQPSYGGTDVTGTYWPTQSYKRMPPSGTLNFYCRVAELPCDCVAFAWQTAGLPAFGANCSANHVGTLLPQRIRCLPFSNLKIISEEPQERYQGDKEPQKW